MAVNKVIYGNQTVLDISDSTVTPETLGKDETAYDKSGKKITGTMKAGGGGNVDACTVVFEPWAPTMIMYYACIVVDDDGLVLATSLHSDTWDTNHYSKWGDSYSPTPFPFTMTDVACGTSILFWCNSGAMEAAVAITGGGRCVYHDNSRFQFITPYTAGETMKITITDID